MRIIAGTAKGHKLKCASDLRARPTTDRVKESVFNLCIPYLPSENILDLFAGSGALGLEALSRGCACATFVESDRGMINIIKDNAAHTKLDEQCEIVCSDAFKFLAACKKKYDIIFLDPPYNKDLLNKSISAIIDNGVLNAGGVIVCETDKEILKSVDLTVIKDVTYGNTRIILLK